MTLNKGRSTLGLTGLSWGGGMAGVLSLLLAPRPNLVYAALPVSLVYVLVDKLGGIEADLATGGLGI